MGFPEGWLPLSVLAHDFFTIQIPTTLRHNYIYPFKNHATFYLLSEPSSPLILWISPMATSAAAAATAYVKAVMIVYFLSKRVRLVRLFEPYLGGADVDGKREEEGVQGIHLGLFLSLCFSPATRIAAMTESPLPGLTQFRRSEP